MNASTFAPGGSETVITRGAYQYNGRNRRTARKLATDADGVLDQQRVMYYSAGWQLIEEDVDDDLPQANGDERNVEYLWGARYIDDIIMRREEELSGPGGSLKTRYYLTDVQFSVVAILDDAADIVERISYTPYGEVRHHLISDLTGDGDSTTADLNVIFANWGSFGKGDLNRDGTVDGTDQAIWSGDSATALPAGDLSFASEDNIIGYAGYIHDAGSQLKLARNRYYNPTLGRWLTRDPAGYVDGPNLYEASTSNPILSTDPSGTITLRGPLALLVSWINPMSVGQLTAAKASVTNSYWLVYGAPGRVTRGLINAAVRGLAMSANPAPPSWFTPWTFAFWDSLREHRGWLWIEPKIKCCNGKISSAPPARMNFHNGWTPARTPFGTRYYRASGSANSTRRGFRDPMSGLAGDCITFTALGHAKLSSTADAMQQLLLTGRPAPSISREIEYRICCDKSVKIDYRGSYFPSHRAYLEGGLTPFVAWMGPTFWQVGQRLQNNGMLGPFMFHGGGIIPPTHIESVESQATEVK